MKLTDINPNNPYSVPQGYFDALPGRILQALPAEPQPASKSPSRVAKPRRTWMAWAAPLAAAACLACAVLITRGIASHPSTPIAALTETTATGESTYDEDYSAAVLEYAMVDDLAIYAYLSGSY